MKLSIMEAALVAAFGAIEDKVAHAAEHGHEWRNRDRIPIFDEFNQFMGDELIDEDTRLAFSRSTLEGFDYCIRVSFWDAEGELDYFILDIGIREPCLSVRMNEENPEAVFSQLEDLGTVIDALARIDMMDEELKEEQRRLHEAQEEYARRRSRFTVIEST